MPSQAGGGEALTPEQHALLESCWTKPGFKQNVSLRHMNKFYIEYPDLEQWGHTNANFSSRRLASYSSRRFAS